MNQIIFIYQAYAAYQEYEERNTFENMSFQHQPPSICDLLALTQHSFNSHIFQNHTLHEE